MSKLPKWIIERPISHRGLHSGDAKVPENSLKAFEESIKKEFPIELDVHLLKDNQIVVFHDDTLERMCGKNIQINELTSEQLNSFYLLKSNERIPLLKEVFDLVMGRVPILIEIKSSKRNKKIHEPLLELLNQYEGEIAIQSFNPFLLKWFVFNSPEIIRGQLSSSFKSEKMNFLLKYLLRGYLFNVYSKPNFLAHEIEDLSENKKLKRLRKKGIPVLGWTVKDKKISDAISSYCDNIIFENYLP